MHTHGEFFVIQHHFASYKFAVEAQFPYHRSHTAPEMPTVKIKELPIILIKPKIKIVISILIKIHIPYWHSGTGNTNHYSILTTTQNQKKIHLIVLTYRLH